MDPDLETKEHGPPAAVIFGFVREGGCRLPRSRSILVGGGGDTRYVPATTQGGDRMEEWNGPGMAWHGMLHMVAVDLDTLCPVSSGELVDPANPQRSLLAVPGR